LIGREFNGTTVPVAGGALVCGVASLMFVLFAEKGRLFRGQHTGGEAAAIMSNQEQPSAAIPERIR